MALKTGKRFANFPRKPVRTHVVVVFLKGGKNRRGGNLKKTPGKRGKETRPFRHQWGKVRDSSEGHEKRGRWPEKPKPGQRTVRSTCTSTLKGNQSSSRRCGGRKAGEWRPPKTNMNGGETIYMERFHLPNRRKVKPTGGRKAFGSPVFVD